MVRYGLQILRWCRRWDLQEADAEDVLLKLNSRITSFAYDASGSFRAWLKTLAHHAWRDLVDEQRRAGLGGGKGRLAAFLASREAGADLAEELQEKFRRELRDGAIERVRPRVSSRAWEVFRLTALEGWSGAAAAAHLQMKIAQVYFAKSRVTQWIREEVRRPEGGPEGAR